MSEFARAEAYATSLGVDRARMNELIKETRAEMLKDVTADPNIYEAEDIEQLRTNDWQVERFLLRKKCNLNETLEMARSTLKFRKEIKMASSKPTDFPEELFHSGVIFGFDHDIHGNGVLYFRVKVHKKQKEWEPLLKAFCMHVVNTVDQENKGKGLTVVFECSGAGLSNLDMDLVWFLVDSLIKYYPFGLHKILVYEMPWVLKSAWAIIKSWMPEEFRDKIIFITKKNIPEYIASSNLPHYLGGTSKRNFHEIPKGCRSLIDLAEAKGISNKDAAKVVKALQSVLDDANNEVKALKAAF